MASLDLETLALKVAIALNDAYSEKANPIANRAKDLPQLVLQVGLVHALAFYMSKVEDEDSYRKLYSYLVNRIGMGPSSNVTKQEIRDILSKESAGEGKGYLTLLAVATVFISNEVANINECKDLSSLKDVAKCLLKLKESKEVATLEKRLLNYLVISKRFLEAFYKE